MGSTGAITNLPLADLKNGISKGCGCWNVCKLGHGCTSALHGVVSMDGVDCLEVRYPAGSFKPQGIMVDLCRFVQMICFGYPAESFKPQGIMVDLCK